MRTILNTFALKGNKLVQEQVDTGPVLSVRPLPPTQTAMPKDLHDAFPLAAKHEAPLQVATCLVMARDREPNGPTKRYFLVPAADKVKPDMCVL